ncbi:MsnO8 family LLM class oxidoreductase [Flavobacterium sp. ST-87]|uniref:MsnO8 family LLM class oxidoreductase n=1 Tax=Flavobacterium plantiphilum TaxID=3163297 RepID=A0ABW8XU27_9FLAO
MRLSILDLSIVPQNGDRHQALMNTLETAKQADELGYTRFWLAQHYAAKAGAGRSPEVMIPFIAAHTHKIKVGSGALLLNHYSPFKVAEIFNTMEELFPGRIDMGIGRASTGMISDLALQRHRFVGSKKNDDSEQQVVELLNWMHQDFDDENPFSEIISYNNGTSPDFWLLGSGSWSSKTAASLGLRYVFAGFINPAMSFNIVQNYHKEFTPSDYSAKQKPELILALNVFAAETEEKAHRMTAPYQLFEHRLKTEGDTQSLLEDEETALILLGNKFRSPEINLIDPRQPPRFLAATPDKLYDWINQIATAFGAHEIMIQTITGNHQERLKSNRLLAEVFFKNTFS